MVLEVGEGARETALDRALGDAEGVSGLVHAEVEKKAEHHDIAVVLLAAALGAIAWFFPTRLMSAVVAVLSIVVLMAMWATILTGIMRQ